jgi:FixJ family two-component response regulator
MTRSQPHGSIKPLIAVVDDDASFLRSIGRLLSSVGYAVKTFGSARDFLASLSEFPPQCVVVDIHMPEMSGLELQDWLLAHGFCAPVILMTGNDTPHPRARARQAGGFGFLLKPFDKEALLNAVALVLNGQLPGAPLG